MGRSGYASHLPILSIVQSYLAAKDVIEFGCGTYSTPYLLSTCSSLITIELDDVWLKKVEGILEEKLKSRWKGYVVKDEVQATHDVNYVRECDMIFVDGGDPHQRHLIVQECMDRNLAPAIVMHDTERSLFAYHTMTLPGGWYYVRCEADMPWTSVVTPDPNLVCLLSAVWDTTVCSDTHALSTIPYRSIAGIKK